MECIGIRVAEMPQSTRVFVVEGPNLGSTCFGMPSMDNCLKDSAWIPGCHSEVLEPRATSV